MVAHQSHTGLGCEGARAEATVGRIVTVLQPLQVGLDHAGGVRGHHAVLAHIHPVLETELVRHLALGALAQTHGEI